MSENNYSSNNDDIDKPQTYEKFEGDGYLLLRCTLCIKSELFSEMQDLVMHCAKIHSLHLLIHRVCHYVDDGDINIIQCLICDSRHSTINNFATHVNEAHMEFFVLNEGPILLCKCKVCGKLDSFVYEILFHLKSHARDPADDDNC